VIGDPGIAKEQCAGLFMGDGEFKSVDQERIAACPQGHLGGQAVGPHFGLATIPLALR